MAKHLPIGGSTIARTIACPAWIKRKEEMKTVQASAGHAANVGNLLHDAMELHYESGQDFESMLGKVTFAGLVLDETHLPLLHQMREHTEAVLDKYNIDLIVCEPFVEYIPDRAGGSIDLLGVSEDGKTALVLDYKTGAGVVRAEDNKQLQFYTLCASTDKKTKDLFKHATNFIGAIVQPRVFSEADIWEFTPKHLDKHQAEVEQALTQDHAKTGKHCAFCPVAPFCKEKIALAESALLLNTKDTKKLSKSVAIAKELAQWCEEVLTAGLDYAQKGVQIEGFKVVQGRSIRKWGDDKQAQDKLTTLLGDKAYTSKLISPTQALKLTKEDLSELIVKPEGKPTLVSDDDPREQINLANGAEKLKKALDKNLVK